MKRAPASPAPRRAAALVEFAVVLPLLTIILLGLWEISRLIEACQLLATATREGARQASTGGLTAAQTRQAVLATLSHSGLPTEHVAVRVVNLSSPEVDVALAQPLDRLRVSVSIPYRDVRWLAFSVFSGDDTRLSAESTWVSM